MEIKEKTLVKLDYKGTLEDGSIFDTSEGKAPLEFVFGLGMIIPGLEEGIAGLVAGDKKTIKVSPEKAYGPVQDEAKQEVPKEQLPKDAPLEVGMQLAAQGPQGVIPVTIVEIKDKTVILDFNHPLAGKELTFEIEVKDVREASEEDMQKFMAPPANGGGCSGGACSDDNSEKECCGSGSCHTETDKKE